MAYLSIHACITMICRQLITEKFDNIWTQILTVSLEMNASEIVSMEYRDHHFSLSFLYKIINCTEVTSK